MKLTELTEAYGEQGTKLSNRELNFIFDAVENNEIMDVSEMNGIIEDYLVDYVRNKNSLRLAMVRAHVLVHGMIPLNMQPNSTWYAKIPEEMQMVAIDRGHDPFEAVESAKADVEERQRHVKEPVAVDMMSKEYMSNKGKYKPSIRKNRDNIVQNIMKGTPAPEAMMAFLAK